MKTADSDVLILGGGVIGLACAYYLLQAGRSVRVLERGTAGGATSHGNCGTITPSHAPPLAAPGTLVKALKWMTRPDAPLYLKPRWDPALARWLLQFAARCNHRDWHASARSKGALLSLSRTLLEQLVQAHSLDCRFESLGLRYAYRDPRALDKDLADLPALREFGVEAQAMTGAALEADEPALLPGMAGAILQIGLPDRQSHAPRLPRFFRLKHVICNVPCGREADLTIIDHLSQFADEPIG